MSLGGVSIICFISVRRNTWQKSTYRLSGPLRVLLCSAVYHIVPYWLHNLMQNRWNQLKAVLLTFLLYVLQDCSHLVVHGETVDSISLHNEWLHKNPHCRDEEMLRPRLLATAQDRHERLKSMTLAEALLLYPFLATEVSVCFQLLFFCMQYVVILVHFIFSCWWSSKLSSRGQQPTAFKMAAVKWGPSSLIGEVQMRWQRSRKWQLVIQHCYCLYFQSVGKKPVVILGDSHSCRCRLCQFWIFALQCIV